MNWKKAVFFGGAVLVLSACDNATAPTSPSALSRLDAGTASSKATTTTTTTAPSDTTKTPINTPTSCSGMLIHVGLDGQVLLVCPAQIM